MAYAAALLVDAENVRGFGKTFEALDRIAGINQFAIRRAFARWETQPRKLKWEARSLSVAMIEAGPVAHSAEATLARHALVLADCLPQLNCFVIVSGDHALAAAATRLRQMEKLVIIAGHERSTSRALKATAHLFVAIPGCSKAQLPAIRQRSEPARLGATEAELDPVRVSPSGKSENGRRILDLLRDRPGFAEKMKLGGLGLSEVANALRSRNDSHFRQKRWLKNLLSRECKNSPFCLARSRQHGEHRLFVRGYIPGEFMIA